MKGGEIIEDHTPEPDSRAAYEMSSDIMGIDLAEFDLYLNQDKTNYEYRGEPPVETGANGKIQRQRAKPVRNTETHIYDEGGKRL